MAVHEIAARPAPPAGPAADAARHARPGLGRAADDAPDADERHRRLLAYGLTEGELALWYDVAGIAGRLLELPEAVPEDRHELVHGMHRVQDQLLARPGRRGVGG